MQATLNHTHLTLLEGDITQIEVDGIVNAANAQLRPGGGVDGAIHRAGGPEIKKALREFKNGCPTGSAVVTTAGNLPAKVIIHAVGPVWRGGRKQEAKLLGSTYSAALQRAEDEELSSIAFPAISTGIYGYPLVEACDVAFDAVLRHVRHATGLENILFVLFSRSDFDVYAQKLRSLIDSEEDLELESMS